MRKLLLAVVCCFVLGGCIRVLPNTEEPSAKPTEIPTSESETSISDALSEIFKSNTSTPAPSPSPTPTAEQKEQEKETFKSTCRKYAEDTYERLMREDTKTGTRICLEVEVSQKMESLLTDSYRVIGTNNSWDEEYVIYDYRENDNKKILVGDKLIVYGEFNRLGEFNRSLTGNTVEIPIVNAKHIEFINDNLESTSEAKATATPIPWVVEFNQPGEVFSEYNYMDKLDGSVRIDGITYEFDDWGDLIISLKGEVLEFNDDFYIAYKIYDEEDYVIEDGLVRIDGLKKGDKFKNKSIYFYDAEKANYRLELSDR